MNLESRAAKFLRDAVWPYMQRVGDWSQHNFKDQKGLGCFAPLLGVGEEVLYELSNLNDEQDEEEYLEKLEDSYFDAMVFTLDFIHRSKVNLYEPKVFNRILGLLWADPVHFVGIASKELNVSLKRIYGYDSMMVYGRMMQIMLKRVQGIRGYADNDKFANDFTFCSILLLYALATELFAETHNYEDRWSGMEQRFTTTVETVLKRDWTKPNGQLS